MDKDEREDKNRASAILSENKRSSCKVLFSKLRALLQAHGYPEKEEGEKTLQSTADLSQKKGEEEGNPESSVPKPDFAPFFHSYDNFHRNILQSIGTFIMILSTDGVIIYAMENVYTLLGYTTCYHILLLMKELDELVGKKLLSLLPDEEKRDVFQKICLKFPASNLVGRCIEFCCHLRRGELQNDNTITYEHAKFFLCLKSITDEPLGVLTRFFPCPKYIESSNTELPLEDRFYMVGTVCILNTHILWERLTQKDTTGQVPPIIEISDDENSSTKGQMEPLRSASSGSASCDTEQYDSQESALTSGDTSPAYPETTGSSATTPSQNLEHESSMEEGSAIAEMEHVQCTEAMEEEVKQLDKTFKITSPIAVYIKKREEELIMHFKKNLEENTQMLQADIKKQRKELKLLKEQLNTMQASKFQMQPTMPQHTGSYEPEALEPAPKKQCTGQTKSCSDTSETQSVYTLCPPRSIRFYELYKDPAPFGSSSQVQFTDAFSQSTAGEQDKNIESQEEESQIFVPEDQQKQDMSPVIYSTDSDVFPASSSSTPVYSDSDISTLETTLDYLQLWPKIYDPNSNIKYVVKSWPCTDQNDGNSSEPRVCCYYSCHPVEVGQEELSPGYETEETSSPRDSQDTTDDPIEKANAYLSSDQSDSDD